MTAARRRQPAAGRGRRGPCDKIVRANSRGADAMPRVYLFAIAVLALASVAHAQTGRVFGVVKDAGGKPIKGAIVRAVNASAIPREFTSTTDDKGRFAMLGLRTLA